MYHLVHPTDKDWRPTVTDTGTAKQRLLDATMDYVGTYGLSELSLRQLATAVGTSHRMLIYHFGSKEGLLVEVVRAVEARQRAALAELDPDLPPAEVAWQFWQRLADPTLWPHERLFFELYGQALQGRPGTTGLLDRIVDSWLEPTAQWYRRHGASEQEAAANARLGLAVTRGLLLDLLATGDREGVDLAMKRFIASMAPAVKSTVD